MQIAEIYPLTIQDIPYIRHLQPDGWGDISPGILSYCLLPFCSPIKAISDDRIVGVGNLILHKDTAWLAHIIVDPTHRGQGVGRQIVEYLVDQAYRIGISSIHLIATDLGAPVYEKVGFRAVGNYQFLRKVREGTPLQIDRQLIIGSRQHARQIIDMDQQITGEDRIELLRDYVHQSIVFDDGGRIEGYYLPDLGQGPIYATTARAALALMGLKYSTVDIAVLPDTNTVGIDFLMTLGFDRQENTAVRMSLGRDIAWRPDRIFSRIGGNYG